MQDKRGNPVGNKEDHRPSQGTREKLELERALRQAVKDGCLDRVATILAAGVADINACGRDGNSPLHLAVKSGHNKVFDWLLRRDGINLDVGDKCGMTPLMCAAKWDNDHAVNELLVRLSLEQINAQDNSGNTALILAAAKGHLEAVRKLVNVEGINLNTRARDGHTALESAMDYHNPEVVRFLAGLPGIKQAGARINRRYNATITDRENPQKLQYCRGHYNQLGKPLKPRRTTEPVSTSSSGTVLALRCG